MKRILETAGLLLAAGFALPLVGQQAHPNVATGTRTESLYVDAGSDQVNLFNGNLSYAIPVGEPIPVGPVLRIAPKLVYNSHLTKTWQVLCGAPPYYDEVNFVEAPTGDRAFGAGWQLHFGRLVAEPSGWSYQKPGACSARLAQAAAGIAAPSASGAGMWSTGFAYQAPDGSVHVFYDRQLEDPNALPGAPPTTGWACADTTQRNPNSHCFGYTHDGSFLRLDPIDFENGNAPVVYFPDGTRQVLAFAGGRVAPDLDDSFSGSEAASFLSFSSEPVKRKVYGFEESGPWNTTSVLDPWGNAITVAYYGQSACRTATACAPGHPLSGSPAWRRDAIVWSAWDAAAPSVRYVELQATSVSPFGELLPAVTGISTLSSSGNAASPDRAAWSLDWSYSTSGFLRLASLQMPLGLTLAATYQDSEVPYVQEKDLLESVTLPTGGRVEWDYAPIFFYQKQAQECPGSCAFAFSRTAGLGVEKRRAVRRVVPFGGTATVESAETQYVRSYDHDPDPGSPYSPCSSTSLADCQMRVDVWAPGAGGENKTVTRSRFHESDGLFKGAFYGRPIWTQDFRVAANTTPHRDALASLTPFRTTAFAYDFDGPQTGGQPNAPGSEHNSRTLRTTTTWLGGRTLEEHHDAASGLSSWDPYTGHFKRTVTQETIPGRSPTILRELNETWYLYPTGASGAWNLGLLNTRKTSRPAGAGDPAATYLSTNESYLYDATGFMTTRSIVSDDTVAGDSRTLSRVLTRGTLASAPCLKNGAAYPECTNRGFPTTETLKLTGRYYGTVSSTYVRSFYYRHGTLAAAHDNVGFYAVDRDVAATGKVVGERGPEGRTYLTDPYPQLTTTTTYDLLGRVVSVQPPGEGPEEIVWGTQDVLRRKKDVGLNVVETSQTFFDQLGRPTAERKWMPGNPQLPAGEWACRFTVLDAAGRRTGQTEWWKNSDLGAGSTLCDAPRDVQGPVSSISHPFSTPRGTTWSGFDALDRPTVTELADGTTVADSFEGWWRQSTTRSYNAGQMSTTVVDRDALGQVTSVIEPAAVDSAGNPMNPAETTTYRYDHMGRLIGSVKTGSDAIAGNPVTQTRTRQYDDFGWLTEQTDPEQFLSYYARDARGNALRFVDGVSEIYQTYDAAGRLLNSRRNGEWPPYTYNGSSATWYEIFTYDAMSGFDFGRSNGRLVWSLRSNHAQTNHATADLGWVGVTSYYHYNGLGGRLGFRQQTDLLMPEPALTTPQSAQALAPTKKSPLADAFRIYFEKQGRAAKNDADLKKAVSSPSAALALALGNPLAPSGPARWSYAWDTAGRLASITYPRRDEGNATTVTYGYGWGALTSVTASFRDPFVPGEVKTVTALLDYDAAGRVSETKVTTSPLGGQAFRLAVPRDPSGLSRPGAWDLYRRSETDTQEHRTFSYDGSGNVTSIGSSQSLSTAPTSVDSYAYDARGRLTRDALALRAPQSRAYDGFGNLVSVSGADARILLTDRATNRLAERAVYDWAGRMTEDLSRQVQPTDYIVGRDWYPDGGLMAEFAHVPGSNDTLPGPGVSVWLLDGRAEGAFSFWGDNIACDTAKYHSLVRDEGARMLTEYHASTAAPCSCETPCTWQDRFYSDIVRLGPWATAVNDRTTGLKLEARDHLGTPRYVVNALGDTTSSVRLDSFGTKITGTGDGATRERFTGHERHHVLDDGTSLPVSDYMHARTYVPMLGRFTRPDPANSFSLFNPQSLNRYSYGLNNPTKFVDPDGRSWVSFNRRTETVTIYSTVLRQSFGPYPASNRGQNSASLHSLDTGRYSFLDTSAPHLHGAAGGDTFNGLYGVHGIFRLNGFYDSNGVYHEGVGIHAGRGNRVDGIGRAGYRYSTNGCIRTCEDVVGTLADVAARDPLEYLDVVDEPGPAATEGSSYMGPLARSWKELLGEGGQEERNGSGGKNGSNGGVPVLVRVYDANGWHFEFR